MSEPSTTVAKPGTACLGCRRRKLKCSREQEGCVNCTKADLPCVYPAPEVGIKRKRGPYKKDKPARERHLEDLVRYLEPRTSQSATSPDIAVEHARIKAWANTSPSTNGDVASTSESPANTVRRDTNPSEDLVKDALIALTKSSVTDRESHTEQPHRACPGHGALPERFAPAISNGAASIHPPISRLLEYWHLFTTRVDPIIKVIHCPTLARKIFHYLDHLELIDSATTVLLASVYYSAINSCTATEIRERFGEAREALMERYARFVETALANNYGDPSMEHLQALVIYMSVFRRKENGSNVLALFSLAVRLAQIMGIDREAETTLSPFDTQMRRRLWWHICGLESRAAEEGGARTTSIMEAHIVEFPENLNDLDLDPHAKEPPQPRLGITDMTYTLGRWNIIRLIRSLWKARKQYAGKDPEAMKAEQNRLFEAHKSQIESDFFRHMHESRPYDWMCLRYMKAMLVKARLIIDHPLGKVPKKESTPEERHRLLRASVDIIRLTHVLASDRRIQSWLWYFRGYMQWHALAVVVAELGQSANRQFSLSAWAVVEPMLANWDRTYTTKSGETAWDHVNDLISRARAMRHRAAAIPPAVSRPMPDAAQLPNPTLNVATSIMSPPTSISPMNQGNNFGSYTTPSPHDTCQMFPPSTQSFKDQSQPGAMYYEPTVTELPTPTFDDIDFSAFDVVFGNAAWEMPHNFMDFNETIT
ncbi:Bikaverin cluster transcription factor bik5 [Acrodontium crateriforme]|uniref:Bikaverin cluster transcription factor bik5 n=1 Tax=Acrodontium crateriforme TaxID=150365 RepID=A0AAQ3MDD7_9PEZI|nr:Bikaverin cluster transcription factor bik5 [Acrodontium crateriforme]